jgi:hypothetical protein
LYQEYEVPKSTRISSCYFNGDKFFIGFNEATEKNLYQKSGVENGKNEKILKYLLLESLIFTNFPYGLAIVWFSEDSMFALGTLLLFSLVMVRGSRKRILFLGGAFLLVTGINYDYYFL